MGDRLRLVIAVEVPRRLGEGEGRVRPAAQDDPALLVGHGGDKRPGLLGQGLTRHAACHRHHHVHDEAGVFVDGGVALDLQVAERPALIEHAQADLALPGDRLGLGPVVHGRHQQVVAVGRHVAPRSTAPGRRPDGLVRSAGEVVRTNDRRSDGSMSRSVGRVNGSAASGKISIGP